MTIRLDKNEADKLIRRYGELVGQGLLPAPHMAENSAISRMAREYSLSPNTLQSRLRPGGIYERHGFQVPHDKFKPEEVAAVDHLAHRRYADRANKAEARAKAAERAVITGDILREQVFGMVNKPLKPPDWKSPAPYKGKHQEAIVLLISDIHMGETVNLEEMGGRNAYNATIARNRLRRLFEGIVSLGTDHWSGQPPAVIYCVLMGDLITGEIHEDLEVTNDLLSAPAVKTVCECLIAGLDMLLASFKCPIEVVCLPGNHGRLTRKPRMKGFAINSYDVLTVWWLQSWYDARSEKRIRFSAPESGDWLANIGGWNCLFTHGDRIGSGGGRGFVGPAAPIARGMQKIIQDYAAEGSLVDYVFVGHFHTALELEQGFSNGSLIGPSEYSRTLRMRSAPATQ
jgi:hypothetical protein